MSKLSNMLTMLALLQQGGIQSIKELSETLEVSNRQIRRYRDALEMTGIYIHSITGKNGGYYVDESSNMNMLSVNASEELTLFSKIFEEDKNLSVKMIVDIYKVIGKGLLKQSSLFDEHSLQYIKHLIVIDYAISKKNVLNIDYLTKGKRIVNRKAHSYFVFKKYGKRYLAAFEPNRKKIIYLRLNRINTIEIASDIFEMDKTLLGTSKETVKENQGVFYDDTYEHVKIQSYKENEDLLKEIFNENINVLPINNEIVEVTMKVGNAQEIKTLLLSFGSKVKVLEPEYLRVEIKNEMKESLRQYE